MCTWLSQLLVTDWRMSYDDMTASVDTVIYILYIPSWIYRRRATIDVHENSSATNNYKWCGSKVNLCYRSRRRTKNETAWALLFSIWNFVAVELMTGTAPFETALQRMAIFAAYQSYHPNDAFLIVSCNNLRISYNETRPNRIISFWCPQLALKWKNSYTKRGKSITQFGLALLLGSYFIVQSHPMREVKRFSKLQ